MIWVIGSENELGKEITDLLKQKQALFVTSDSELDILKYENLENFIKSKETEVYYSSHRNLKNPTEGKIDWIINCTSLFDGRYADTGENSKNKMSLNVARVSREHGAKLIHISDFKDNEVEISSTITQYYIIKTSGIFGKKAEGNFSRLISDLGSENRKDFQNASKMQYTSARDLAEVILSIIEKSKKATKLFGKNSALSHGTYIFTNKGSATPYEFAAFVYGELKKKKLVKNECTINPVSENKPASNDVENLESASEETDENRSVSSPDQRKTESTKIISSEILEKQLKYKNSDWKEAVKRML